MVAAYRGADDGEGRGGIGMRSRLQLNVFTERAQSVAIATSRDMNYFTPHAADFFLLNFFCGNDRDV